MESGGMGWGVAERHMRERTYAYPRPIPVAAWQKYNAIL